MIVSENDSSREGFILTLKLQRRAKVLARDPLGIGNCFEEERSRGQRCRSGRLKSTSISFDRESLSSTTCNTSLNLDFLIPLIAWGRTSSLYDQTFSNS